jgi:membrane-anchored protein YejM (alkaline phosphatase superfamily)
MAHTQALVDDPQLSFVFLHLPVPHPPGIYDHQRHVVRSGGNYLDNLVLADDTLGTLMEEISETASAGQTTIIVTSDHSWRIPLWKPAEGWSEEEQRVSGGRFDTRPVLLVHFPGDRSGQDVQAPMTEMIEHDLMAEMLCGRIHDREDLNAFVSGYGR